jgi:general secretion pathway protein A
VPVAAPALQVGAGSAAPLALDEPGEAPLSDTSPLLDERMMRLEKSVVSVLNILKKIVATPAGANSPLNHNNE